MGDLALRRVVVYDEANDRTIELLTNNFEWSAATEAELYRHRWATRAVFQEPEAESADKTFTGTSPNAVRSQIYVALMCYLLLELLRRCTCKASHAFSNFVERIWICLSYYLSLEYVCNTIGQGAKKAHRVTRPPDLFSAENDKCNLLKLKNSSIWDYTDNLFGWQCRWARKSRLYQCLGRWGITWIMRISLQTR